MEIFLTPKEEGAFSTVWEKTEQLTFVPERKGDGRAYFYYHKPFKGVEVASGKINGGYVLEIKIPVNNFLVEKLRPWQVLGLDVNLNDSDRPDRERKISLSWSGGAGNWQSSGKHGFLILGKETWDPLKNNEK